MIGRDHQLLHLYINIQSDMNTLGHVPDDEVFKLSEKEEGKQIRMLILILSV